MLAEPEQWRRYYDGEGAALAAQRHFSYSDRIRYYWPHARARAAVDGLMARLGDGEIPPTLISQYLPLAYAAVRSGTATIDPAALAMAHVAFTLDAYRGACRPDA